MTIPKISTTDVTNTPPIAVIKGSLDDQNIGDNYKVVISANIAAASFGNLLASDDLSNGEVDAAPEDPDEDPGDNPGGNPDEVDFPLISDIQLITNEVVLDSSGNPTARLLFRIHNSSGQVLKGVNAKVGKK